MRVRLVPTCLRSHLAVWSAVVDSNSRLLDDRRRSRARRLACVGSAYRRGVARNRRMDGSFRVVQCVLDSFRPVCAHDDAWVEWRVSRLRPTPPPGGVLHLSLWWVVGKPPNP